MLDMRVDKPQKRGTFKQNDNCSRRPACDKFFDCPGALKYVCRNILINASQMRWACHANSISMYMYIPVAASRQ